MVDKINSCARFLSLFKPNKGFIDNFKKYTLYPDIEPQVGYDINHVEDYREFIIELALTYHYQLLFKKVESGVEYIIMDDNDFRQQ
jgi:hypothetical protein